MVGGEEGGFLTRPSPWLGHSRSTKACASSWPRSAILDDGGRDVACGATTETWSSSQPRVGGERRPHSCAQPICSEKALPQKCAPIPHSAGDQFRDEAVSSFSVANRTIPPSRPHFGLVGVLRYFSSG